MRTLAAGSWERYKGLMQLIGGVIAFAVVVYTALYAVVLVAGECCSGFRRIWPAHV